MTFSVYGTDRSYRLGPGTNTFSGSTRTAAESARDTYFQANPSILAAYDSNSSYLVRLVFNGSTVAQSRINGQWVDYTAYLQGIPGDVASLDSVPVMQIPFKQADGTFAGSGARILDNGSILAPPGFGVQSGSVAFGDVLTLSESAGFLAITNHLDGNVYTLVDFPSPRSAGSGDPQFLKLNAAEQVYNTLTDDSTVITDNPLIYPYTTRLSARTNAVTYRASAPMSNVRIKITQMSNGVALKYIPNKTTWEVGTGGLEWTAGDNVYDFEDTPLILSIGEQLQYEIRATSVNLKGSPTKLPWFSATAQTGTYRTVITDQWYTAQDVQAKLATLTGTNRLDISAIQNAVSSVAGRKGDVLISASDVSGLASVATTGLYTSLTGTPKIPSKFSDLTNDQSLITAAGAPVQSVQGRAGAVVLVKADVGLGNVDNTSDVNKPLTAATQNAVDLKMSQHIQATDPHPQYTTSTRAAAAAPVQTVAGMIGNVTLSTDVVTEGSNLYFTTARVASYLTSTGYTVRTMASSGTGSSVLRDTTSGTTTLRSIIATGPLVATQNANDITLSAPALPSVYNSAGKIATPKIWVGTATVDATTGKWTIDYTSAGFTTVPQVVPVALLNTVTTIPADRSWATLEFGTTTTSASGYVVRGTVLTILGATLRISPAGTTVQVTAIGY